jgi:adenylate cyclase
MAAPKSLICVGCWQHMRLPIPIRGPLAIPLRLFGIKISQMNPNVCTICETMFTKVKRKKQIVIPATVLFADLRGYTTLSELSGESRAVEVLNRFYDVCSAAVWEQDGIVNKFIGDAVLAIFNFPILREDHVRRAVLAGMEIQRLCLEDKRLTTTNAEGQEVPIGVGIGIHTGNATMGEVGTAYKDFTIIGPVVNTASRIQSAAQLGDMLVTDDVYARVADLFPAAEARALQLKGMSQPVNTYLLHSP